MSDATQPMGVLAQNYEHSESMNELFSALSKAQAKNMVAAFNRVNPAFKRTGPDGRPQESRYADLTSIMKTLSAAFPEFGLCVMQFPRVNVADKRVAVRTVLGHSSGQWAACTVDISIPDTTAHKVAAGITYGRRIGLSITGVVADEDDDGNSASGVAEHGAPPPPRQEAPRKYEPPTSLPFKELDGTSMPARGGNGLTPLGDWKFQVTRLLDDVTSDTKLIQWWKDNLNDFVLVVKEHHPETFQWAKDEVTAKVEKLREPRPAEKEPA